MPTVGEEGLEPSAVVLSSPSIPCEDWIRWAGGVT